MIFGELVPKKLGIAVPFPIARRTQLFMRGFTTAMTYPIKLLNGSANAIVRALGVEPQEELRSARSSDELASLAGRSASEGTLDSETAHLVQRSVAFGPRTAGEIMTPRVQMACVDATDPVSEVIELSSTTGFSKFPVIKGTSDNVVGSVHVKQAVAVPRSERAHTLVREVMVDATVVPESLRLDPLLSLLRGEGFQMAIVSDEYGGTAGVVTLEDVVEEIVGDIADEHDRYGSRLRQRPDGSWIVSGLLRPDEVADATGLQLPEDEAYDTVAGLLVRELGRIPSRGDQVLVPLPAFIPDDDDEEPRAGARSCCGSSGWTACGSTASRSGGWLPRKVSCSEQRRPHCGSGCSCCWATRSSSARSSHWSRPVVRRWSRRRPRAPASRGRRCARWRTSRR